MGTPNKNAVWVDEVTVETVNFILGTNAIHLVHQTPEVQLQVIKGAIGLMKIVAEQNVSSCTIREYLHERDTACKHKIASIIYHPIDWKRKILFVSRPTINSIFNPSMIYRGFALMDDGSLLVVDEIMKSSKKEKFIIHTDHIEIYMATDNSLQAMIIDKELTGEFLHLLVQTYQGEISRVRNMEKMLVDGLHSMESVCRRAFIPPFRNLSLIGEE